MLSDAELLAMRATMTPALPDVCDVYRLEAGGTDADGYAVPDAWKRIIAGKACRLGPDAQTETGEGGVPVARGEFVLTIAHDADVTADDVVVVDGTVFEVIGTDAPRSYSVSRRARLMLRPDQTLPVAS